MSKRRIMLVDDEKIIAEDLMRSLENMNYEVAEVISSGEYAVEKASEIKPDLILMDIKLNGEMDGIEAAKIIRDRHNIPIIYLTAYADDNILEKAAKSIPFGYLVKPFEDRELKATIEMAFYKVDLDRELRKNKDFLLEVVDNVPSSIYAKDKNGRYIIANKHLANVYHSNPRDMVGKTDFDFVEDSIIGKEEAKQFMKHDQKVFQDDRMVKIPEEKFTDQNGKVKWFTTTKVPLLSPDGKELVLGVATDITDRKKMEDDLKESYRKMQQLLEETVNGLVSALEKRDPYTAGHQKRVSKLATAIATEMELPTETVNGIRIAALVHDIGKIYVPAEILSKPGRLTEVEFNLIKTHPKAGYDILSKINFPWPVAEIVYQHHERLNGTGYPRGLEGDDIILESRILNVADVMEAIASNRPYRPALGIESAIKEIETKKGIDFDEDISNVCIKLFRENKFQF